MSRDMACAMACSMLWLAPADTVLTCYDMAATTSGFTTGRHQLNRVNTESQHVGTTSVAGDTLQIASVSSTGRLIKLVGLVNQQPVVVMVDSGSTGDFIS